MSEPTHKRPECVCVCLCVPPLAPAHVTGNSPRLCSEHPENVTHESESFHRNSLMLI